MPRPGGKGVDEKPKNFKNAIKRLFKELKGFYGLAAFGLVLAALGSILSIFAPNKLSDLTDEISAGLVVNSKNLELIANKTMVSLNEDNLTKIMNETLNFNLNEEVVANILMNEKINATDKVLFQNTLASISRAETNQEKLALLSNIPSSILDIIMPTSTYQGITIPSSDKQELLQTISNLNNNEDMSSLVIPKTYQNIIFEDFEVDDVTITTNDQVEFIKLMSDVDTENIDANLLYAKIDEMPESIKSVVEPIMNMDKIIGIVIFLVILYVCSALFNYLESLSMTLVSNNFARKLRNRISHKINKLPLKYFDQHQIGDILSRLTNDIDTIAQNLNQSLSTLVSSITLFIGVIIMMFYTNWIMALTAIFSSLIGFGFIFMILSKSQKYFAMRQKELGNLNSHIEEVYSGLNIVKVYNGKEEADKKFDHYNDRVYEANRKSRFLSGLMQPIMGFIGDFGYVAVCIVGALLTMNGHISFGVIVAFITYVRLFTSPLTQIAQALTSLQTTAAASERVFEFVDEEEMRPEQPKVYLKKEEVKGAIEFDNVTFTYDGNEVPTIKNFSAKARPGMKVAIVGPTGAGKTTMVNLLMKFYEINGGDIKIDGISIHDLSRENIHELFTMVLQDTWLFNGTIKENIIYNRENVSDEKVREVCKTVGLDHFIKTLPNTYDYELNDNDSVSAGQKQLLTIARGMIEDAPFLILDEATSNVDTRTEELVQKAMDKLTVGKTSFIIAHRLSTIRNADLILVMKDGNVIETGNHEELMQQNGFYASLYNSQFEL